MNRATTNRGFTLTELMVVIAIIVLITIAVLPAVLGGLEDRKFSESSRAIQAALAGARDRAILSKQPRGVRLVRDENDPWEVTTLIYVGVVEPYSVGKVYTNGLNVEPEKKYTASVLDPHWELVNPGKDQTLGTADDIPRVDAPLKSSPGGTRTREAYIRFNGTGRLYHIGPPAGPLGFGVDDQVSPAELVLDSTGPTPPAYTSGAGGTGPVSYQVFGPPVPLPDEKPLELGDGVVIDLRTVLVTLASSPGPADRELLRLPRSLSIPNQYRRGPMMPWGANGIWGDSDDPSSPALPANWPTLDILFGPNGSVVGPAASNALIHFWIGARGDKGGLGPDGIGGTADDVRPNRPHKLVTLNTRSGAVQFYNEPEPVGTAANSYLQVYGPAESALGVSQIDVP